MASGAGFLCAQAKILWEEPMAAVLAYQRK